MKNNLLKFCSVLLLTLFVFNSCSKDETDLTTEEQSQIKVETKNKIQNFELIEKLEQDLSKLKGAFPVSSQSVSKYEYRTNPKNDTINFDEVKINTEVFNAVANENGKKSYTFKLDFPKEDIYSQEIINLHSYYDENNQLKSQLIKYDLTSEELKIAIENQSFDGFWDKIYYASVDSLKTESNTDLSKIARRNGDPCTCTIIQIPWALGRPGNRYYGPTGYSGNAGYSGVAYTLPPLSTLPPSVTASLQAAGVYTGVDYSKYRSPYYNGPSYNYTAPVIYYTTKDLVIPSSNPTSSRPASTFNNYYGYYYYYGINTIIKDYYETSYNRYIGSYKTTKITLQDHLNKQSFVNSFFTQFLYPLKTQNPTAHEYLRRNSQLLKNIFDFLSKNNASPYEFYKATEFVKWEIEFEMLPKVPCGINHDCVKSIKTMAAGLRRFHGEEGKLMADYFDSLVADFSTFSLADLQVFYDTTYYITTQFNANMRRAIIGGFIEGVTPIIEIALLEVGGPVAIKLLQKIPLSWVLRGTRLNKMVGKIGLLGVQGTSNSIRIVTTNGTPYSKALELFKTLAKNSQSVTVASNGTRVASFTNGNKIVFRAQSSSGFPATLELTFSKIWTKTRIVKFQ